MTADWPLPDLLGYLRTWSAADLEAVWGPADAPRRVAWPLGLPGGRRP